MTFIETIDPAAATGRVAEFYEADRNAAGEVPNFTRAFSSQPEVYAAWRELVGAIKDGMDVRRYELVTVAAATALRSSYCALAHGSILARDFIGAAATGDVVRDRHAAHLDEVDIAVMDLAAQIVTDATAVTAADIAHLRDLGLTDTDISKVVLTATARCFFSKTLDALGAQPDSAFQALEPELRETLVVGRPIAAE